ncbi:hypothetical protein [uncultured Methanobrevibacter sp.]|uniref:hypothetical protein n=1 Tax=uncultured Methanobrevibacter sp. TaxID=253161 RepID=UPI0025E794DA|nr:hypothetical protein [uncultured Methanobrevibacter sp.]
MNKKKAIILILIFILIVIGAFVFYESSLSQKVKVGDSYFTIPKEFQKEDISDNLVRFIANDKILFINSDINASDIDSAVSNYVKFKNQSENLSINVQKLDLDGLTVYKSVVQNNSSVVHYWFIKDNHIYEIYTPTFDSNMETVILNIIKSK